MSERKYHGYTIDEINSKYYFHFNGDEDRGRLNDLNAKLSKKWQDVSSIYVQAKKKLKDAKDLLRKLDAQMKFDIEQLKLKLIKEDRALPKSQRLTDKAREIYSHGEIFNAELKEAFDKVHELINEYQEEVEIWHEVRQNMRVVGEKVKNAQISLAVEAKHTGGYATLSSRQMNDDPIQYIPPQTTGDPVVIPPGKTVCKEGDSF